MIGNHREFDPVGRASCPPLVGTPKWLSVSRLRRDGGQDARPTVGVGAGLHDRLHGHASRGFSMVELLISLAITAALLTATMVAIDTSFKSYASASEMASTHASSRLMVHRLLTMIRTSTAHGPLQPDAGANPPIVLNGSTIESNYIELLAANGDFVRIEYRADEDELWAVITPSGGGSQYEEPVLEGVSSAVFHAHRREDSNGVWVLDRASIDIVVEPGEDSTLSLENGQNAPVRVVASTMPRKLE